MRAPLVFNQPIPEFNQERAPQGDISQYFAESLVDYTKFGMKWHNGLDFGKWKFVNGIWQNVSLGVPVFSFFTGTVQYSRMEDEVTEMFDLGSSFISPYGHRVRVFSPLYEDANFKYDSIHSHLSRFIVQDGQDVAKGEILGFIGKSGNATGFHGHAGVRKRNSNNEVLDYNNGTLGYINFLPLIPTEIKKYFVIKKPDYSEIIKKQLTLLEKLSKLLELIKKRLNL